ncbi:hypothetical protein GCM10018793_37440 [Streptomyces sulfonofaciens]|uniref:Secreted protein n=1 Tax=Streptomyces sulfonofaciens TaxID=68272 RepID=A0A919GBQ4_9ACTN|nr:hypothetical protein [Streptomyces sulfonofaciens]GHH80985.1 hypothetical protein GCM10018793_37440 [Streptomyces sulfonofaciens]
MVSILWRRPLTAACAALIGAGLLVAPAAQAGATPGAPSGSCTTRNGFPPDGGTNIGGDPPRYVSGSSPYLGARYNSCTNKLQVYRGFTSTAHRTYAYYDIRFVQPGRHGWQAKQLPMGQRRVWTITPDTSGDWNFRVRACMRSIDEDGGATCSSWSPQIFVHAV